MAEIATYRFQLHAGFPFDAAAAELDYLAALGVSHVYLSPCTTARPGSTHGYDVVDATAPNPELGGAAAFARLGEALRAAGLGLIVDVVPNHMAIGAENRWWWDVLEYGRASPYARFFDIYWTDVEASAASPLVLPLLGDRYWRVLAAGGITLERDAGHVRVRCAAGLLPAAPESVAAVWRTAARSCDAPALQAVVRRLPSGEARVDRDIWADLTATAAAVFAQEAGAGAALDAALAALNGDVARLDAFLAAQHYRLAFWRAAQAELAYRRFFDVDTLIGLRVEDPAVFEATHALLLDWVARGWVQGVRVDHPDGLRDPAGYLQQLRRRAPDAYVVVEKILAADEPLRPWPVEGTTGYDFLNRVNGLFVDPSGAARLGDICAEFTAAPCDFAATVRLAKLEVLAGGLSADLQRLTARLGELGRRHAQVRDFARAELRDALREYLAALPIYRTYVQAEPRRVAAADREAIASAMAAVRAARPQIDALLLDFLGALLCLDIAGEAETEFVLQLQQLSGPAMAKGVEDTAFYRHQRLVSLNEVGGTPARFGVTPDEFHAANLRIQRDWPRTLLATATHDTKRGEDVRARLNLLSEMPVAWRAAVRHWTARNASHRRGAVPDGDMELLLYQTMLGAWPISAERLWPYMEKAAREAKRHTSWVDPQPQYENALRQFVDGVCGDAVFLADFESVVAPLVWLGRVNGLAQTLLKLTAPGVPDFYQGCELWDLSLVDPDNRRPVDYGVRRRLLAACDDATPEAVLARADEGLPKLWVVRQALALRQRRSDCFGVDGDYRVLPTAGTRAAHAVAFARAEQVVTIVPRLLVRLRDDWRDTDVELPFDAWRNVLSGESGSGRRVALRDLLRRFPVALLERTG